MSVTIVDGTVRRRAGYWTPAVDGYGHENGAGFLDLVAAVWRSRREAYRLSGGRERRERWAEAWGAAAALFEDAAEAAEARNHKQVAGDSWFQAFGSQRLGRPSFATTMRGA